MTAEVQRIIYCDGIAYRRFAHRFTAVKVIYGLRVGQEQRRPVELKR